jgi:hypothetical protein
MSAKNVEIAERITAWQCIGCGKVEAPRECIGVCKDRKVVFVHAEDYDRAVSHAEQARSCNERLASLLTRFAWSTPRTGEWEHCYRTLQLEARRLLSEAASAAIAE